MCDQRTHDPAAMFDALERDVLYLLTDPERYQPVWRVEDIAREIETTDPMMILGPLRRAGLVHLSPEGFVFATRAATRMVQIVGHVL
jgi:Mn-dependent DtxR family transcriptional regulator